MQIRNALFAITVLPCLSSMALGQAAAPPAAPPMTLTSSAFVEGGVIPDKYTQAVAAPVSPALAWDNAPAGTVSFTLITHDPDAAPRKGVADVLHWLAFNIPGTAHSLPEGVPTTATLADGTVQPVNTGGKNGFMGPGSRGVYHHYTFELYALDTKLNLGAEATRAEILAAMDGHVIGKMTLTGRFHR